MFKQVLLGEDKDLDILAQTQWPELESSSNRRKRRNNNITDNIIDKNQEINNYAKNDSIKTLSEASSSNINQTYEFPNLIESLGMSVDKRKDITDSEQNKSGKKVKKCKKFKKSPSKAPLCLDLSTMLKLSLVLSEKKQHKKRKLHSKLRCLPIQEQLSLKVIKNGNKLDSDCPVRYKGKKRPHRKRKISKIKLSFQQTEKEYKSIISSQLNVYLNRIRQSILNDVSKGEAVDELVNNLGRFTLDDVSNDEKNELISVDCHKTALSLLHTKDFKPYCNHLRKTELKDKSKEFIKTLRLFQDRSFAKDPIKCKSKRRYVCGCREVRKFLRAESVKLLFFASNLSVENVMPQILEEILQMSADSNIPVLFSGTASDFGYWTLKKSKISIIAILSYEGAEKLYKELIEDLNKAKQDYQILLQKVIFCLQSQCKGDVKDFLSEDGLFQEVEEQIRDNIISKLT